LSEAQEEDVPVDDLHAGCCEKLPLSPFASYGGEKIKMVRVHEGLDKGRGENDSIAERPTSATWVDNKFQRLNLPEDAQTV
jgi:hypothetical protein